MEAIECSGKWWLPGEEERPAYGTLKVSESGRMELSLLSELGPARIQILDKRHPIILGSVNKSPCGKRATLTDTFLSGSTFGSFENTHETYHVGRGYFGAHLPDKSSFAFGSMRLQIGGLGEWIHPLSGFGREGPAFGEIGQAQPMGFYTRQNPITVAVPGGTLDLGFGLSGNYTIAEYHFHEIAQIKVTSEKPLSADEFSNQYGSPLRNLMSFVCDKAQTISKFSVFLPEEPHDEILVVGKLKQPIAGDGDDKVYRHDMLFTLQDVDVNAFIEKWLAFNKEYAAVCDVYFALMYGPPAFVDIAFQNVTNAIQLYHAREPAGTASRAKDERRLKEILASLPLPDRNWLLDHIGVSADASFRSVLRELLERRGDSIDPLIGGQRDRFVDESSGTLDYILRRELEDRPGAKFGADLYWLTQKIRFLLKACILHEIGFTAEQIRQCFAKNHLYQHIRQLELPGESSADRE